MSTPVASPSSNDASPAPMSLRKDNRLFLNVRKQAKFILLGLGLCYWFDTLSRLELALGSDKSWARPMTFLSLALLVLSIGLFAALMLLPLRGKPLDYQAWQSDPHLRHLIPSLTLTLSLGFTNLLLTLSPLFSSSLSYPTKRKLSLPSEYLWRLNDFGAKLGISFERRIQLGELLGKTGLFDHNAEFNRTDLRPAWPPAIASAVGTYMLVLGTVGLLGMVSTRTTWGKPSIGKGSKAM